MEHSAGVCGEMGVFVLLNCLLVYPLDKTTLRLMSPAVSARIAHWNLSIAFTGASAHSSIADKFGQWSVSSLYTAAGLLDARLSLMFAMKVSWRLGTRHLSSVQKRKATLSTSA